MRALSVPLVLAICACGPAPLEPRDPTPGRAHFTIQSYNVTAERFSDAATVEAVGQANADIVCLQETGREWRPVLERRYAERYPYMLFGASEGAGGLAVLSRFPLTDEGEMESPNGANPHWHPAWSVTADTGREGIRILHVHLRAILSGRDTDTEAYFTVDEDHELEMRTFASQFDMTVPRSLVVGDFNEEPDGPAVRYVEGHGYSNVLPLYHPGQPTWYEPSLGGQLNKTLDHILFDGTFSPLNSWALRAGNSDHIPVLAHLELDDTVF